MEAGSQFLWQGLKEGQESAGGRTMLSVSQGRVWGQHLLISTPGGGHGALFTSFSQ